MSGFFGPLARGLLTPPALRPRLPSPYERSVALVPMPDQVAGEGIVDRPFPEDASPLPAPAPAAPLAPATPAFAPVAHPEPVLPPVRARLDSPPPLQSDPARALTLSFPSERPQPRATQEDHSSPRGETPPRSAHLSEREPSRDTPPRLTEPPRVERLAPAGPLLQIIERTSVEAQVAPLTTSARPPWPTPREGQSPSRPERTLAPASTAAAPRVEIHIGSIEVHPAPAASPTSVPRVDSAPASRPRAQSLQEYLEGRRSDRGSRSTGA